MIVGSKSFTESVILGELAAERARAAGAHVKHQQGLGGSTVLWNALRNGEVDIYPEYTGTLSKEILAGQGVEGEEALRRTLAPMGIGMSRPLGFNNTYALGMKEDVADRKNIQTISDLRAHPELKLGFSNEFMDRGDGWPGLRKHYRLPQKDVRGLEHALAYRGLDNGAIDVTDLYSTDPEIHSHQLRRLRDDRHYFPDYHAVLVYRIDLHKRAPRALENILQLEGRISRAAMMEMNVRAKPKDAERVPEEQVAADFLAEQPFFQQGKAESGTAGNEVVRERFGASLLQHTLEHLWLVACSLTAAIVCAVPLGILAARRPRLGQLILGASGIVQTIPSLALLVFLIPFFGLGTKPAIVALFLYSLLPIVRNTYTGLHDISAQIRESAEALGLPAFARLRLVELPLASRAILAGIKTSAVINVGTATLGGLIGAGGYGQLIMKGIRLDNVGIILEGAVPAAVLALLVQGLFELCERALVPRGLRLSSRASG